MPYSADIRQSLPFRTVVKRVRGASDDLLLSRTNSVPGSKERGSVETWCRKNKHGEVAYREETGGSPLTTREFCVIRQKEGGL